MYYFKIIRKGETVYVVETNDFTFKIVTENDLLEIVENSELFAPRNHTHFKGQIVDLEEITPTPTPNAIPKAGSSGKINLGWIPQGSYSGLDADLLDGRHADEFALSSHNHDNIYSPIGHTHTKSEITDLEVIATNPTPYAIPKADGYGKIDLGWIPQGTGSGLDVDMVDGRHADEFALATHIHNASDIENNVVIPTSDYTCTDSDRVVLLNGVNCTLPSAYHPNGKSKILFIRNIGSNDIVIRSVNSEYIEGSSEYTLYGNNGVILVSDGSSNWYIVAKFSG